jgi:hypothetical protein
MISDMKKDELKVGMKVRVSEADPRGHLRGEEAVITSLVTKAGYTDGVIHAVVDGEEYAFWVTELDSIESPEEYTLHGRPLQMGDMVWSTASKGWVYLGSYAGMSKAGASLWIDNLAYITCNPQDFAWDVPPVVDPRTIPPPLCFIDGLPVRVGSIMYHKSVDTAVTVCGPGFTFRGHRTVEVLDREGMRFPAGLHLLSWDFPNTPPPPKKVPQVRTRWYNIYEHDATRTSYSTFSSEEEAKKYALQGCVGQGSFQYEFVGPEAKQK